MCSPAASLVPWTIWPCRIRRLLRSPSTARWRWPDLPPDVDLAQQLEAAGSDRHAAPAPRGARGRPSAVGAAFVAAVAVGRLGRRRRLVRAGAKRRRELRGGRVPLLDGARQRALQDRQEPGVLRARGQLDRGLARGDPVEGRHRRLAVEGAPPGEELAEQRADAEQVAAAVHALAVHLLRATCSRPSRARSGSVAPEEVQNAMPKSMIRAEPSSVRNTFAGLMSRWTIPALCAWPRPSSTCATIETFSASESVGSCRSRA